MKEEEKIENGEADSERGEEQRQLQYSFDASSQNDCLVECQNRERCDRPSFKADIYR